MRLAYFDCFSGISGDMLLGALVDLGVPIDWLSGRLARIPLDGFSLRAEIVSRGSISGTKVHVEAEEAGVSRTWADIRSLLEAAAVSEAVRSRALSVFSRLAGVEARIHGCPVEEVHFHEVGGTDAIVDIVGTLIGLERLGIERIVASALPLGSGMARCRHGMIPVPAPATVGLLEGLPVYGAGIEAELVTPTGAALVGALADGFGPVPAMHIEKSGYGAGSVDLPDRPNLLRILTGKARPDAPRLASESVSVLEAVVDDMNPELFGYLMERLFENGALDVCWVPVYMKKNRPGTRVEVVCRPEKTEALITTLFSESTSTGVRYQQVARRVLPRESISVETEFGPVSAKQIRMPDGTLRLTPEYEACRSIAAARKVPIWRIYEAAARSGRGPGKSDGEGGSPESV